MTAPALPRCGPTHHHACACREAHFAQVERELAEARAALAQLRDAVCAARRYLAAHLWAERRPHALDDELERQAVLQELRDTLAETAPAFRVRVKAR